MAIFCNNEYSFQLPSVIAQASGQTEEDKAINASSISTASANNSSSFSFESPVAGFNLPQGYLVAIKHLYDAPFLEAHHYCRQGGDIAVTCLIFDSKSTDANLIGIDYIISASDYNSLPDREKPNWVHMTEELAEEEQINFPYLTPQQTQELFQKIGDAYSKLIVTWNPNDNLPSYPSQVVISDNPFLVDKTR